MNRESGWDLPGGRVDWEASGLRTEPWLPAGGGREWSHEERSERLTGQGEWLGTEARGRKRLRKVYLFILRIYLFYLFLAAPGLSCSTQALCWGVRDLSSLTRDRTHVPCIGRRILYYWTTREVPGRFFLGERFKMYNFRVSLVAQWLRIHLPMQGTRVQDLVWEDPTCRWATKPVHRKYWACSLGPESLNYWACAPRARAPQQEKPPQWEARAPQQRVVPARHN